MKNNTLSSHGSRLRPALAAAALATVAAFALPAAAQAPAPADAKAPPKAAPARPPARAADMPVCKGELPQPVSIGVVAGKSTLVKLPGPISLRTLADAKVVQARLLSPDTLYILGVAVGSTNMITQDASGRCTLFDIAVGMDPGPLRAKLAQVMPDEKGIVVLAAADTLILKGTVSDAVQVEHAMNIATAYVRYSQDTDKNLQSSPNDTEGLGRMHTRVINMLSVASPQQVMLQVRVAEVSKPMVEKLGAELKWTGTSGDWTYGILSSFLSGGAGVLGGVKDGLSKFITIDAEKKDGLIKILAEPNVIAISGQEGSFLAGGKLYLPVAQSTTTGGSVVTLEQVEFGVGLKFTPTVLSNGLINLKVAPEVSEPSKEGLTVQASSVANRTVLPLITTRRATTTVQLYDGQTLVIGGLIKNSMVANIKAFPLLGELPILGALFRSSDFAADRSEVLFVVTPRLVKPVAGPVPLPTDNFVEPSRTDVFLRGRLEGTAPAPSSAPPAPPPATSPQPSSQPK
jgi:pilus assembly protein CpaC